jgi:uncharacterized protein (DUF362 family)
MRADISLVDANLVIEDNFDAAFGPSRRLGLLIASNAIVAADLFCTNSMNLIQNLFHISRKRCRKV